MGKELIASDKMGVVIFVVLALLGYIWSSARRPRAPNRGRLLKKPRSENHRFSIKKKLPIKSGICRFGKSVRKILAVIMLSVIPVSMDARFAI
jgi:hypothetical protein